MKLYHLPGNVQRIIRGIQIQFIVDDFTTFWQRVEKGVFTGYAISPILFVMGMGILPMINSGIYQPPIRHFMDDLTVTTSTHIYKQDGPFQRWKIAFPSINSIDPINSRNSMQLDALESCLTNHS